MQEDFYHTSHLEDEGEFHGGANQGCTESKSLKTIQGPLSSNLVAIDAN
jgi:hypothetical protein